MIGKLAQIKTIKKWMIHLRNVTSRFETKMKCDGLFFFWKVDGRV